MTPTQKKPRGRPRKTPEDRCRTIGISLAPDVAAAYDALGHGKSGRVNDILRAALIGTIQAKEDAPR